MCCSRRRAFVSHEPLALTLHAIPLPMKPYAGMMLLQHAKPLHTERNAGGDSVMATATSARATTTPPSNLCCP